MSLSSSQITLVNNSTEVQTINTLSINPSEELLIWDTKTNPTNDEALGRYIQIKDYPNDVKTLVAGGDITIIQDTIVMVEDQIIPLFSQMHVIYFNNTKLLNQLPTLKTDSLKENDGRVNVTPTPVGWGWLTWFSGKGDDLNPIYPSSGRGEGESMSLTVDSDSDGYIEIKFKEPIHIHDGQVYWDENFDHTDHFSVGMKCPATTVTEASENGNCNLIPTGLGYNMIVPALENNGDYNVNLGSSDSDVGDVVPIMISGSYPNGYWDINYDTGKLRPADVENAGSFNLYDIELPEMFFIKNIPMGNPQKIFDIDVYKTQYFHQSWSLVFSVEKKSANTGTATGWILSFRKYVY